MEFEQISIKSGFMKHNGGLLFREISESEFEFKTIIEKKHLNSAGITHGGYISSIIDSGAGTGAHRITSNSLCVTIPIYEIAPESGSSEHTPLGPCPRYSFCNIS